MINENWNDILKVDPPQRTDILVWDESCNKARIMSAYPETDPNDDCEECKERRNKPRRLKRAPTIFVMVSNAF